MRFAVSFGLSCILLLDGVLGSCSAAEPTTLRYPGKTQRDRLDNSYIELQEWRKAEPDSAPIEAGIAHNRIFMWCYGFEPHARVMPDAAIAVKRALQLDPKFASAHTARGIVMMGQREWEQAEWSLRRAVELEPQRSESLHWLALYLAAMGRHEEAKTFSKQAYVHDPSAGMAIARSSIQYFERDWDGMIRLLTKTMEQAPEYGAVYDWLGMAYVEKKQFDKALPTYERAAVLSDNLAEVLGGLGHAYGMAGRFDNAQVVRGKMLQMSERWHVPPVQIAFVHISLGHYEQALDRLEQAFADRSWEMNFIQVEAWLDPIRDQPRFQRLLEKMNFPKEAG